MMNNNEENKKEKNLKQISILIIFTILIVFTGYLLLPSIHENSNNIQNENIQTNTITETSINIGIENIPQYSGQMVISINNNIPYFEDSDITTDNFEDYSLLDDFERAGVAFANICKYTMPKERN